MRILGLASEGVRCARVARQLGVAVGGAGALIVLGAPAASAHDGIEEALARGAGPSNWVHVLVALLTVAGLVAITVARLLQVSGVISGPGLRYWSQLGQLLSAWLLVGITQAMASRFMWATPGWLWYVGYLLLPAALLMVWVVVLTNYRPGLSVVLSTRRYRWVAVTVGLSFLSISLWAGNMVAVAEPDDLPPAGTAAFVAVGWTHGPVAAWPTLEFWLPGPEIFGALSAGMVPVLLTIASLMGLAWAAGTYALLQRLRGTSAGVAGMGRLAGLGTVSTAGLNACCCCAPAMYPILALLIGPAAGASVSVWFLGSSSPFFDLGLVAMIALMIGSLRSLLPRDAVTTSLGSTPPASTVAPSSVSVR